MIDHINKTGSRFWCLPLKRDMDNFLNRDRVLSASLGFRDGLAAASRYGQDFVLRCWCCPFRARHSIQRHSVSMCAWTSTMSPLRMAATDVILRLQSGVRACLNRINNATTPAYTFAVFHPPLENNHSVKSPTEVSEINTPQKTPECCQPRWMAST
jgi:hypothetical protein